MNFITYVEELKQKRYKKNIDLVRKKNNAPWTVEKIRNYIEKFGNYLPYTVKDVQLLIQDNDIVASFFAKNPSKQNVGERVAAEILELQRLPRQGADSARFSAEGEIIFQNRIDSTKAADFYYNGYYVICKYTEGRGSGQDSQKEDVINFLVKAALGKHKAGAILDGVYWEDKHREQMRKLFQHNENIVVSSIQEILDIEGGLNAVFK